MLANNGVVTEEARTALERAVALDPKPHRAAILLVIAKEQDGQFAAAIEDWRALLANRRADAPWRKMVEQRLARMRLSSPASRSQVRRLPAEASRTAGGTGPSADDVAAAQKMNPADRQAMIEQHGAAACRRLDQDGDDLAGWLKLVRAYSVLDRKDDARRRLPAPRRKFSGNTQALQQLDQLAAELGLKS